MAAWAQLASPLASPDTDAEGGVAFGWPMHRGLAELSGAEREHLLAHVAPANGTSALALEFQKNADLSDPSTLARCMSRAAFQRMASAGGWPGHETPARMRDFYSAFNVTRNPQGLIWGDYALGTFALSTVMNGLPPNQKSLLIRVKKELLFTLYDADGDGVLQGADVCATIGKLLVAAGRAPNPTTIDVIFKKIEQSKMFPVAAGAMTNHSLSITRPQFIEFAWELFVAEVGPLAFEPLRSINKSSSPVLYPANTLRGLLPNQLTEFLTAKLQFTQADLQLFQSVFERFSVDAPQDVLSLTNFRQFAAAFRPRLTLDMTAAFHRVMNLTGNPAGLDLPSFATGLALLWAPWAKSSVVNSHRFDRTRQEMIFGFFDVDCSGKFSFPEFERMLREILAHGGVFDDAIVKEKVGLSAPLFHPDHDGCISMNEFVRGVVMGNLARHGIKTNSLFHVDRDAGDEAAATELLRRGKQLLL